MIIQGKLRRCGCGGNAFQRKIGFEYEVYCHDCENTTGMKKTMADATRAWNTQVCFEGVSWDDEMEHNAIKSWGDQ